MSALISMVEPRMACPRTDCIVFRQLTSIHLATRSRDEPTNVAKAVYWVCLLPTDDLEQRRAVTSDMTAIIST